MALAASVLWLVGIEAIPALHQESHDELAPHTHGGAAHRHAAPAKRAGSELAIETPAQDAGELGHRDLAIRPPAPPVTGALPIDRRPLPSVGDLADSCAAATPTEPTARGPPVT